MILPNFICPGAAKAGTTSLYDILQQHPSVFLSPVNKESHFFDYDENYSKGLEWYSQTFFDKCNGPSAIGDITPSYMFLPRAVERLHRDLGTDTRFIFMLRDPVDRAYSQYNFNVRRSYESRSFEEALASEKESTKKDFFSLIHYSYTARGRYSEQVARFLKLFPRDRLMFIHFEDDFLEKKAHTIRSLETFLGIDHAILDLDAHANAASQPRSGVLNRMLFRNRTLRAVGKVLIPSYESRRSVFRKLKKINEKPVSTGELPEGRKAEIFNRYFAGDIDLLQDLTGRDFSRWCR